MSGGQASHFHVTSWRLPYYITETSFCIHTTGMLAFFSLTNCICVSLVAISCLLCLLPLILIIKGYYSKLTFFLKAKCVLIFFFWMENLISQYEKIINVPLFRSHSKSDDETYSHSTRDDSHEDKLSTDKSMTEWRDLMFTQFGWCE